MVGWGVYDRNVVYTFVILAHIKACRCTTKNSTKTMPSSKPTTTSPVTPPLVGGGVSKASARRKASPRADDPAGRIFFNHNSKACPAFEGARENHPDAEHAFACDLDGGFRSDLSNFAHCEPALLVDGGVFRVPTVEHAFHLSKFLLAGEKDAAAKFAYPADGDGVPAVGVLGKDARAARKLVKLPAAFFKEQWTPLAADRALTAFCMQKFAPGARVGASLRPAHALLMATGRATLEHGTRGNIGAAHWLMDARDALRPRE